MKRILFCLLFLLWASSALAAGTITAKATPLHVLGQPQRLVLTLTCTGDAAGGTFPTYTINPSDLKIFGWYLYSVETNPGAGPPQDNYDITIINGDGVDVAGSLLLNRHTTTSQLVYIGTVGYPVIRENWTWTMSGNNVNSAVIVATLVFTAN